MKSNTAKEKQDMNEATKPLSDFADAALKNYEQALRTGLRFQEEAGRWWGSMVNEACRHDWQRQVNGFTDMAHHLAPAAQQRMDEVLTLMEKNKRAGAELMRQACDAAQTHDLAASQAKWLDFWTSSVGAVRSHVEAVGEIGAKTMDSWAEYIRENAEANGIRMPKAS